MSHYTAKSINCPAKLFADSRLLVFQHNLCRNAISWVIYWRLDWWESQGKPLNESPKAMQEYFDIGERAFWRAVNQGKAAGLFDREGIANWRSTWIKTMDIVIEETPGEAKIEAKPRLTKVSVQTDISVSPDCQIGQSTRTNMSVHHKHSLKQSLIQRFRRKKISFPKTQISEQKQEQEGWADGQTEGHSIEGFKAPPSETASPNALSASLVVRQEAKPKVPGPIMGLPASAPTALPTSKPTFDCLHHWATPMGVVEALHRTALELYGSDEFGQSLAKIPRNKPEVDLADAQKVLDKLDEYAVFDETALKGWMRITIREASQSESPQWIRVAMMFKTWNVSRRLLPDINVRRPKEVK